MEIDPDIITERLIRFRQTLHKHPEVSGQENNTATLVKDFISGFSPSRIITGIGGSGLAAIYEGEQKGPTIMFRCELDALPIREVNAFSYQSVNENVSHKCGHDGHMAILAGLAAKLEQDRVTKGKVILLFQPAEETGEGARRVINDKRYGDIKPDYVFALHNIPGYAQHQIVCREGSFTPSVNTLIINLQGKTSHAAEPENGINPAKAVAEIISLAAATENRNDKSQEFFLVTPVHMELGEKAYGTSAGEAEVTFTLRSFDHNRMEERSAVFIDKVVKIAHDHHLETEHHWEESFTATENNSSMTEMVRKAAIECGLTYKEKDTPFRWGEDFGLFTQQHDGAMFGLGAGISTPALHNPDYDFPDEIIATGASMFMAIAGQLLK